MNFSNLCHFCLVSSFQLFLLSTEFAERVIWIEDFEGKNSENSNFANILKREGVALIGPNASAIKKMGDKI